MNTSIAVVGASENGIPWTSMLLTSLGRYGFSGDVWPVNPNRSEVLGRRCYATVDDLPGVPDVAFVLLGAQRAISVCERLADLGCPEVVVVSNGFRESGTPEGLAREAALRDTCAGTQTRLVGPNCVGFARFHEGICALGQPVPRGIMPGNISIVSQSGGLTGAAMGAVQAQDLGIDVCYSIGNGAAFGLNEALRFALDRETTSVVCAVVESIEQPEEFEAIVAAAQAAGKHLAVLLLGQSEGSRGVAASHTGAVVGEYRMTASWLEKLRVPVATSAEELGRMALLLGQMGRPKPGRGVLIATVSGGGAGLTGDIAVRARVPMAQMTTETRETLSGLLPEGAFVGNPLDVATGDAPAVYAAIAADPTVGVLVEPWVLPWPDESPDYRWQRDAIERVTAVGKANDVPVIVGSLFTQPVSDWARRFAAEHGIVVTSDLERTLAALARIYGRDRIPGVSGTPATTSVRKRPAGRRIASGGRHGLVTEADGRAILTRIGLPVVGGAECATVDDVVAAGERMVGPFALKLSLPGLGHRERVGGIRLGLQGEEPLRRACAEIAASALAAGVAGADDPHFLLEEMVFGPELLVGLIRDPLAGPTLTLSVGGWAAEADATFGTLALPLDDGELLATVRAWRLPHLLGQQRCDHLVTTLERLIEEFVDGNLAVYSTVEINPLIVTKDGAKVVDVLMIG